MEKVLRLTRHEAGEEQMAELRRLFGKDITVETVSETLPSNTRDMVARFDELAADASVVEAVLPANLLEAVLKFSSFSKGGGMVIRAVTSREVNAEGNATFTFQYYERVVEVKIVTERL